MFFYNKFGSPTALMTVSLTGARTVPASPALGGKIEKKLFSPSFRFAEQIMCPASAEGLSPQLLPTLNPELPLLYLWSLVRPFLFPAYRIAAVSSWLAANCCSWVCPWVFSKQKEKAESSRFLQSQLSQRAHICPVERHRHLWAGWEHECSQGAPVSGGHRACLHQPDGNRQGQR